MNILAVDDDELQLKLLSATIVDQGLAAPATASSAQEAIDVITASLVPFDLFLLDIRMPGTDGIRLCERIRRMPGYDETPAIMITALSDRKHMERAFSAGATDYVTKPFDKLELMTRIRLASQATCVKKDAERHKFALTSLQHEIYESAGATLEAPVTILGVPDVVDYLLLSNFMLEMPFIKTLTANAFAVKVRDFEKLYYSTNPGETYALLTSVAEVLSEQLAGRGYCIAYAGTGLFVCASQQLGRIVLDELVSEVGSRISEIRFADRSGKSQSISLVFGRQQTNGLFTIHRRIGLLLRAAASVEGTAARGRDHQGRADGSRRTSALHWFLRLTGASHG